MPLLLQQLILACVPAESARTRGFRLRHRGADGARLQEEEAMPAAELALYLFILGSAV